MINTKTLLQTALEQARLGASEGGVPIGAALFDEKGKLLGAGRNRRIQKNDPALHAETDAFRRAGRQKDYRSTIMVTTLAPCWYCSGLIRQFRIGRVVVGEAQTFSGGLEWLRECGIAVDVLESEECQSLLEAFIKQKPDIWNEDIGEI